MKILGNNAMMEQSELGFLPCSQVATSLEIGLKEHLLTVPQTGLNFQIFYFFKNERCAV